MDDRLLSAPVFVYADLKPSKAYETNENIRVNITAGIMPGSELYKIDEEKVWAYFNVPGGVVTGQLAVSYHVGGSYGSAAQYTGSVVLAGPYAIDSYEVNFEAYCEDWALYGQAQRFFEVRATNSGYLAISAPNDGDTWRTNVFSINVEGQMDLNGSGIVSVYNPLAEYTNNLIEISAFKFKDVKLVQGNQTISVIGTNAVSGEYDKDWVHVDVNTNPPTLNIDSPSDYLLVNVGSTNISGTVGNTIWLNGNGLVYSNSENGVEGQIYLAGTWNTSVELIEGTNTITIKARDIYGNKSERIVHIIRDMTAPVSPVITYPVTVNGGESVTIYTNGLIPITEVTGTKEEKSYARQNGNSSGMLQNYSGLTWEYGSNMSTEGTYVYVIDSADEAGNPSALSASLTIVYDLTLPSLTVSELGRTNNASSINFSGTGSDTLSGPLNVVVSGDGTGGPFSATGGTWNGTVSGLSEGSNNVTFTLYDRAGNASVIESRYVFVDTLSPTLEITAAENGNDYATSLSNVIFSGTATDSGSGIVGNEVVWSNITRGVGGAITITLGTWDASPVELQDGINELQVSAIDGVGQISIATQTITYEENPADLRIELSNDYQRTILSWEGGERTTIEAQTNQYYEETGPWYVLATSVESPYIHEEASNYWSCYYRSVGGDYSVGKMTYNILQSDGIQANENWVSSPFDFQDPRDGSILEYLSFDQLGVHNGLTDQPGPPLNRDMIMSQEGIGGNALQATRGDGVWYASNSNATNWYRKQMYKIIINKSHAGLSLPFTLYGLVATNDNVNLGIVQQSDGIIPQENWCVGYFSWLVDFDASGIINVVSNQPGPPFNRDLVMSQNGIGGNSLQSQRGDGFWYVNDANSTNLFPGQGYNIIINKIHTIPATKTWIQNR